MCETEREREGGGTETHTEERKTEGEERVWGGVTERMCENEGGEGERHRE